MGILSNLSSLELQRACNCSTLISTSMSSSDGQRTAILERKRESKNTFSNIPRGLSRLAAISCVTVPPALCQKDSGLFLCKRRTLKFCLTGAQEYKDALKHFFCACIYSGEHPSSETISGRNRKYFYL